jgi:hypothetical protein
VVTEHLIVVPDVSLLEISPEITRKTILTTFSYYPGMICIGIQYLKRVQKVARQIMEFPNRIEHFSAQKEDLNSMKWRKFFDWKILLHWV